MDVCSQCAVRETAICQSLSADDLEELARGGRRQTLGPGETLIWEGEDSLLVGNVIGGVLKLSHTSSDGRDQTLGVVYPGDFIGRPFGAKNGQTVSALTEAQVCTFRRSSFDAFARDHADLEHHLLERTLAQLDTTREWLLLLGRMSASQRLAAFLLQTARRLGERSNEGGPALHVQLPFGRQDIAEILGLTVETVSRTFTRFRDQGLIETPDRRSVVILDPANLEAAVE